MIQKISDSEFEYYLRLDPKVVESRFRFFLTMILSLGIMTLFYQPDALPLHFLMGSLTIAIAILGFLVSIHKFKHIKFVGVSIMWMLYIRSADLLVKIFTVENTVVLGTIVKALLWFMLGSSFIVNWVILIEPYYQFIQRFNLRQPTISATPKKK